MDWIIVPSIALGLVWGLVLLRCDRAERIREARLRSSLIRATAQAFRVHEMAREHSAALAALAAGEAREAALEARSRSLEVEVEDLRARVACGGGSSC